MASGIDLPPLQQDLTPIPSASKEDVFADNKKSGFRITPGGVIGTMTGVALGMATNKAVRTLGNNNIPVIVNKDLSRDYIAQTNNLVKTMDVIFSPLGVTIVYKDNGKNVPIDMVSVDNMTREMYSAWQHRDKDFFKNIVSAKMFADLHLAERIYASKLIDKTLGFERMCMKKANENSDVSMLDFDIDEHFSCELVKHAEHISNVISKDIYPVDIIESIAYEANDECESYLIETNASMSSEDTFELNEKIAGIFSFSSKDDVRHLQKILADPSSLSNKAIVSFLPDRVIFSYEGVLIDTLLAMDMNTDTFEHFKKKDKSHFKNLLKENSIIGLSRMNGHSPAPENIFNEKKASVEDRGVVFTRTDIHPVVYHAILTDKFGTEWIEFDAEALIKMIEDEWSVDEIEVVALHKILSIHAANNGDNVFRSPHAFEKIIRSFAEKPIDFMKKESGDISMANLAFCIDVLDRVTPKTDLYAELDSSIYDYIAGIMAKTECYYFDPTFIIGSPMEPVFKSILNFSATNVINADMLSESNGDLFVEKEVRDNNEKIRDIVTAILPSVRTQFSVKKIPANELEGFVLNMCNKINVDKSIRNIVFNQVALNIAIDDYLIAKEDILKEQIMFFEIKGVDVVNE